MKEGKAYIGDEIAEGNKLICEFVGGKYRADTSDYDGFFIGDSFIYVEGLEYHSSWDWLIPAWYKFLCVADEVLGLEKNERYRNDTHRIFHNCIDNNNCERAAMFLVERITWYNQNKQS